MNQVIEHVTDAAGVEHTRLVGIAINFGEHETYASGGYRYGRDGSVRTMDSNRVLTTRRCTWIPIIRRRA